MLAFLKVLELQFKANQIASGQSICRRHNKRAILMEATKKLFTVDEYYKMAGAGVFAEEDRLELIDGQIIEMSPIGNAHLGCVNAAVDAFTAAFRGRAVVSVQNPLRLNDYTEFQPDVVLLKPRKDAYRGKRPVAEDTLLVVEVSDTTLAYDRNVKVPHFAAAGVPEVWIEDLTGGVLLVFRDPSGSSYKTCLTLNREDTISAQSFPEIVFDISELLG
jgi:Uma2 family endonuclease